MTTTKINNSSLMLHCGAAAATYDDLLAVDTPEPYATVPDATRATTYPIPHHRLVDQVKECLDAIGWSVTAEAYGLMRGSVKHWGETKSFEGANLYGLIGLSHPDVDLDRHQAAYTMSFRNSHVQDFQAKGSMATYHFLCDNSADLSSGTVMSFGRRHTRFADRDLLKVISDPMANLVDQAQDVGRRLDTYQSCEISEDEGRVFITRAAEADVLPWGKAGKLLTEWVRKDGCGGIDEAGYSDRSIMRMMNCFTELDRRRFEDDSAAQPSYQAARRGRALSMMLDQVSGFVPTVSLGPVSSN